MEFADAAWWEMVAATIAALHVEVDLPMTMRTLGALAFQAREQGHDVTALRAWLATQPHPAPAPPVPTPTAPPVPAPAPLPPPTLRGAALVAAVKADLEGRGVTLTGPCGAFAITSRVAWALRDEGAGLLEKRGGNNCRGYSTDFVVFRQGPSFDVLGDSGGANVPQWAQDDDPALRARWRPPVDPEVV